MTNVIKLSLVVVRFTKTNTTNLSFYTYPYMCRANRGTHSSCSGGTNRPRSCKASRGSHVLSGISPGPERLETRLALLVVRQWHVGSIFPCFIRTSTSQFGKVLPIIIMYISTSNGLYCQFIFRPSKNKRNCTSFL